MMLAKSFLWISAIGLPLVILAGSIDFGGILPWSRWMAAVASLALTIIACAGYALSRIDRSRSKPQSNAATEATSAATISALLPAALLLAATLYVGMQTVELPSGLVQWFSPASANAYLQWGSIPGEIERDQIPVSVDVDSTLHVFATLLAISAFAVTAAFSLTDRSTIAQFFVWIAVGGAMAAAFGMYRLGTGDPFVFNARVHGFGVFVNRNAAALWMNLGLASSLGLIAYRSMERFGTEVDDPNVELNDWIGLLGDPIAVTGMISGLLNLIGLLACGSRGGIVALVVGIMTALGWLRGGRGWKTIPLAMLAVVIGLVVLVVPFRLSMRSLKRFSLFTETGTGTLAEDGRMQHWHDGISAAKGYLPMGSGAGTYADAYRPFQEKSSQATFAHADNLWLEWCVELGFFGIAMIILVAIFMIIQLNRLSESEDAIDQAVRVAGWYTLASVAVAECFNFGLLYLCNGLFFVAMASVLGYRGRMAKSLVKQDDDSDAAGCRIVPETTPSSGKPALVQGANCLVLLVPTLAIAGCFFAVTKLGEDAKVASALRARKTDGSPSQFTTSELTQWVNRIEGLPKNSAVHSELASLQFTLGRRFDLRDLAPNSDDEAVELFRQTQTSWRRLWWDQSGTVNGPRPLSPDAVSAYDRSIESAQRALARRPLAIEPRTQLIASDFHHQNVSLAQKMYDDLDMLVQTNATELYKLGRYAAGSKDYERTFRTWNRAMQLAPSVTTLILPEIFARRIDWQQWKIPDAPEVSLVATQWLLKQTDPNRELIERTLAKIECGSQDSQEDLVRCFHTSAEAKLVLGSVDDAFDDYRAAVKANPVAADLRIDFANRLLTYGFQDEALLEARMANHAIPKDPRFVDFLDQFSAGDLPSVQEPPINQANPKNGNPAFSPANQP